MATKHVWSGAIFPVKPDAAAVELERIREAHGGVLDTPDVVDASRPVEAVLHECFTWDDREAAEKCRNEEARRIIRSVRVVPANENDPPQIKYIHVQALNPTGGYRPTVEVMSQDDARKAALSEALAALGGLKERYRHLEELQPVFDAADDVGKKSRKKNAG